MDAIHSKEETTRLRTQIGDLRGKLNDLENKVSVSVHVVCLSAIYQLSGCVFNADCCDQYIRQGVTVAYRPAP